MTQVVLGLGSNRSYEGCDPVHSLFLAWKRLCDSLKEPVCSNVYKTGAMYVTDQDDFYNMAVSGFYSGTPQELLDLAHEIEADLGRNRNLEYRNGPRSLDIDIELFGSDQIKTENLIIPHERMTERAFVLKPLLDILKQTADKHSDNVDKDTNLLNLVPFSAENIAKMLKNVENQRIDFFMDSDTFCKMQY